MEGTPTQETVRYGMLQVQHVYNVLLPTSRLLQVVICRTRITHAAYHAHSSITPITKYQTQAIKLLTDERMCYGTVP